MMKQDSKTACSTERREFESHDQIPDPVLNIVMYYMKKLNKTKIFKVRGIKSIRSMTRLGKARGLESSCR